MSALRPAVALGLGLGMMAIAGCTPASLADYDDIYSQGAEHRVLCAANLDDRYGWDVDALAGGLERARADQQSLHVYAHNPEVTIRVATLEAMLDGARERDLDLVTYKDLADGYQGPSMVLSFDDNFIDAWFALRPLFARYDAHVTFFVSKFQQLSADQRAELHQLADDGHDIEYHTTNHVRATDYVAAHGLAGYVDDEIRPALDLMRADGFDPTIFAYPFGDRSAEIDAELLTHFRYLRGIIAHCPQ